jgi:hypothetical protein
MSEKFYSDYFYGVESELFSYYRIPKQLITDKNFKDLSTDAKLLYGLMLDRMTLSAKNGWYDDHGRVYIFYALDEIENAMNCAHGKAVKLLAELDTKKGIGLIERVKQGQGHPTIIYVKQFILRQKLYNQQGNTDFSKSEVQTSEKRKSRFPKSRNADFRKSECIYPDNSYPEKSYLKQSTNPSDGQPIDRGSCKERIRSNIDYDWLALRLDASRMEDVDELVSLMVDTICSSKPTAKISGEEIPIEEVRERFFSLDASHIEYVLESVRNTTTKIRNIHAYLLAALYRAPTTINHYYMAEVQHDEQENP